MEYSRIITGKQIIRCHYSCLLVVVNMYEHCNVYKHMKFST